MRTRDHRQLPSIDLLRDTFSYNADTGQVTAKKASGTRKAGAAVGFKQGGYYSASIDGKEFRLHRIIWALHYGHDPGHYFVDHVNRNKLDNRIKNLRLVTCQQNNFNSKATGITYRKDTGKWQASIWRDYKRVGLGCYDCPLMARLAYEDAKSELHKIP
jgi:HNH endonuclease/AP2 domain